MIRRESMNRLVHGAVVIALAGAAATSVPPQDGSVNCKPVHADLVETRSTTGCRAGHAACFLGSVDGNHGLRGTTYFRGDSATAPIPTSPEFVGYGGAFEYTTDRGTLIARESGVTSMIQQVVTAHQRIVEGTGDFAGVTGHFFVSGSNTGTQVVTKVTGELCYP
jgi:hypothetical protein